MKRVQPPAVHGPARQWRVTAVAGGSHGDLFAVVAETTRPLTGGGTLRCPVVARGSIEQRTVFGASCVAVAEYRLAVVDGGARPVLLVGTWRDQPLQGLDLVTGECLWRSPDLRRIESIESGQNTRMAGVSLRAGAAKLISADTGKYRLTLSRAAKIVPDETRLAVLSSRAGDARVGVHNLPDGSPAFECVVETTSLRDAAFNGEIVVFAGVGLYAFNRIGQRLWAFAPPRTFFSSVISASKGFKAIAHPEGSATYLLNIDNAGVSKEPCVLPYAFLTQKFVGPELIINSAGDVIDTASGRVTWNFMDALEEAASGAVTQDVTAESIPAPVEARTERVRHPHFGLGTVIRRLDGKICVRFDDGVVRTLAEHYLSVVRE